MSITKRTDKQSDKKVTRSDSDAFASFLVNCWWGLFPFSCHGLAAHLKYRRLVLGAHLYRLLFRLQHNRLLSSLDLWCRLLLCDDLRQCSGLLTADVCDCGLGLLAFCWSGGGGYAHL